MRSPWKRPVWDLNRLFQPDGCNGISRRVKRYKTDRKPGVRCSVRVPKSLVCAADWNAVVQSLGCIAGFGDSIGLRQLKIASALQTAASGLETTAFQSYGQK